MNARTRIGSRYRLRPDVIRLGVRPGVAPSGEAPVRIFLGSEDGQWRAERVFVYAIERVRDPARSYEIHLMKNLAGFDRRRWRTGFTNYRFAVPELAGGVGRAIYNDVDQIYLEDPAHLFDQSLSGHGFLSVSPEDTSVMLIDCARMCPVWNLDAARSKTKAELLRAVEPGSHMWGVLAGEWNARDTEYPRDRIRLLHYTALHLQPWRPFPEIYSYHDHPLADLWFNLERRADERGYQVFTRCAPSAGFTSGFELLHAPCQDEVLVSGLAERLPAEDVPWILDHLFATAGKGLFLTVNCVDAATEETVDVRCSRRTPSWWLAQLAAASRRSPSVSWQLVACTPSRTRTFRSEAREEQPSIWVLEGHRLGDVLQLRRIADALGWRTEHKRLHYNPLHLLPGWLLGRSLASVRNREVLVPPWPDVVIASGKRSSSAARWIRAQSNGRTRIINVGRPWSRLDEFDLVVTTPQYQLPARSNTLHLSLPITSRTRAELAAAREQAAPPRLPGPRIAVLVGGSSTSCALTVRAAGALGAMANDLAVRQGGSLLVSGSPRTSARAFRALMRRVTVPHDTWAYGQADRPNPYLEFLASADQIIVTGDSVSMLADALATGRPVQIFPLPRSVLARILGAVQMPVAWLTGRRRTYRGTPSQQGPLARAYDRLVDLGLLTPPRDLDHLHDVLTVRGLVNGGCARRDQARLAEAELRLVVDRIGRLMREGREVASL
ncbi:MAG: ELM1/GtrOC1 family putative glycosyltransferase [Pseudomonadales bacterium]